MLTVDPAAKEVVGARAWNNSTIGPQNSNDNFILELTEQWGLEAEYETVYEAVVYADEMGREPAGEITGPITRALLQGTFEEGLYIPASNASAQPRTGVRPRDPCHHHVPRYPGRSSHRA